MLLRAVAIGHERRQTEPVGGTHFNDDPFAHEPNLSSRLTERTSNRTHPYDFIHYSRRQPASIAGKAVRTGIF